MSLLSELQRRNVFRVAATYAVSAWLLVQVSTTVLPLFGAPEWVLRALVVVLVAGAIPLLILAWAFELTPQGLKTQAEADAAGLPSRFRGPRMNLAIGALLVLSLALFTLGRYSVGPAATPGATVPAAAHDASIAVLPFVNMSADKDNEYFSDGLSETLLNMLAQVPDLKVAGRTSSFAFKGKNQDLRAIGAALGVSNVLEGSVQKAGDTVRITAQLIAVSDGTHRWSKSYDRKLDDVFRIQDEIANEVTGALKLALQPGVRERLTQKRTDNVESYQEYLKGLALLPKRKVSELRDAAAHFERAVELDPGFARAYVGAADAYLLLDDYDRHDPERLARAKRYVERAIDLAPALGEPHASLALYLMRVQNLEQVEPELKKAIALAPSHASAYQWYSSYLRFQPGRAQDSLDLIRKAVALEPLSPVVRLHLALSEAAAGDTEQGRATIAKLVQDFPDYPGGHRVLAEIAAGKGDLVGALRAHHAHDALDPESSYRAIRCGILLNFGAARQADACLESFPPEDNGQVPQTMRSVNAMVRGDLDAAWEHSGRSPDPDPSLRVMLLLKMGRSAEALALAKQSLPELFSAPPPRIQSNQRFFALIVGAVLVKAGNPGEGRGMLERVLQAAREPGSELEGEWPWLEAVALDLLGRRDDALAALERRVEAGACTWMELLDADALLSGLRSDPRYEAAIAPARAKAAEQVALAEKAGLLQPVSAP